MTGLDEHDITPNRHQRPSFATYFLAGSGILVAVMFLSAAFYLATMS